MQLTNILKLLCSLLLSTLIGSERERLDKPAGLRDVMLTTLGATIFTIIATSLPSYLNTAVNSYLRYDIGRIIAYTVVGIGFLGSGVILRTKRSIEGITTASTLWCSVAIGMLVGLGDYLLAFISSLLIYAVLKLKYIKIKITKRRKVKR